MKLKHVSPDEYGRHLQDLLRPLKGEVDEISHFILRLGYCRTEEKRRWLLTHETALMKYRLSTVQDTAFASVLPEAKLLSQEELEQIQPLILAATPGLTLVNATKIYSVAFTHALDLVQTRQVYVSRGRAYIPQSKLLHLVTAKFRAQLSKQLTFLSTVSLKDSRLAAFCNNLATISAANQGDEDYEASDLNHANVAAHLKHMPLCMANLQLGLKSDKKLKHWGRLQYGLFLKGAGLSLEDALVYFEKTFTATNNFAKEYAYNVRHMYGKEGARKNYTPYSCSKIIHGNPPNSGDYHGCPYKHNTVQQVTTLLSRMGVSPKDQTKILNYQKAHNYQLACVEHFHLTHPKVKSDIDNVGNHPNAWFQASVAYAKANDTGSSAEQTAQAVAPASNPQALVSP